ncbi:MAG: GTP-binding protein, partial [Cyanobacteria bacterium J06576_12]
VVAGSLGAGKTRWIWEQMASSDSPQPVSQPVVYINPLTVGVDAYLLQLDMPQLQIETDLFQAIEKFQGQTIYLELSSLLSLEVPLLDKISHYRVAVVSPNCPSRSEWEAWADKIVVGQDVQGPDMSSALSSAPRLDSTGEKVDIWQASLRGQVLDPASLNTFWQELVQGAYGQMIRAKAVLEIADGQSLYIDHLPQQETTYRDLPLPKWLDGRPQRFSGIEMVGIGLDKSAIAATLQDCCLTDATLKAHQAALKQSQAHLSQNYAQEAA